MKALLAGALERLTAFLHSTREGLQLLYDTAEPVWKQRMGPFVQLSFWLGAACVGVGAVYYARLVEAAQALFFALYRVHPYATLCGVPFAFASATALVVKLAPAARGSGIPQVMGAITECGAPGGLKTLSLVSLRTAFVKILSSCVGVFAGASIGREGPTVQLSASAFAAIGRLTQRYIPQIEMQSYLVAGAAGGVAAAFNTPIAGITFALEELAEDVFGQFKHFVLTTVIIAGICAQALAGNYLYFGRPSTVEATLGLVPATLLIGAAGGLFGGLLARLLAVVPFDFLPRHWLARSFACGLVCATLIWLTDGATAGSGYELTREFMDGRVTSMPWYFAPAKLAATVFSYLSGMAGGIFAPSLSIGAGFGVSIGELLGLMSLKTCALIGMVAFFTGAVQAPITAIMIVVEMSDKHSLVMPLMAGALVANTVSKRVMPTPLYKQLAKRMLNAS